MSDVILDNYMNTKRERDELASRAADLENENQELRDALMRACELREASHENERQLWAFRQAANMFSQPFSYERVMSYHDAWPAEVERLSRAKTLALARAAALERRRRELLGALDSAINWISATQFRVSDEDHKRFADHLKQVLDGATDGATEERSDT